MIRIVRWTFTVLCTVLAAAATAWLLHMWIAGFASSLWLAWTWTDRFDEPGGSGYRWHALQLRLTRNVILTHSADWCGAPQPLQFDSDFDSAGPGGTGFAWRSNRHPSGLDWDVMVPAWSFLLLWLVPMAAWRDLNRARLAQARRRAAGLCPACGYDLRASKDRCPECGRPISSA
jgi:hypothetical protein